MNDDMPQLYRRLYLAARNNVSEGFRDDVDYVKEIRDIAVNSLYPGRNYRELDAAELRDCISTLEIRNNPDRSRYIPRATPDQRRALYYYAIGIALTFAELDGLEVDTGNTIVNGEDARPFLQELFDAGRHLPRHVLAHLMQYYINPLLNRWLVDGEFKKFTKNPEKIYINSLLRPEAQYLITRLKAMNNNIPLYSQGG